MAAYESVVCVKNEVFVYQIPARPSNRGYRAADWTLDKPDWVGRMKIITKENDLYIRLEDKNSGELFAQCPVEGYPSIAVEQVLDSSRYFVIRIQDESGRKAFIGIGFADRGDSFDLLVAIQDHFKHVKREETQKIEEEKGIEALQAAPKLDLGFKEGQTIRINISTKRQGDENSPSHTNKPRSRGQAGGGMGILPPPPGGASRIAPPPRAPSAIADHPNPANMSQNNTFDLFGSSQPPPPQQSNPVSSSSGANNVDFLLNFGSSSSASPALLPSSNTGFQPLQPQPAAKPAPSADPWGDFTSAAGSTSQSNQQSNNWVNFE